MNAELIMSFLSKIRDTAVTISHSVTSTWGKIHSRPCLVIFLVLTGLALFYLATLYGTIPFIHGRMGIPLVSTGRAISLARGSLFEYPTHIAYPTGAPIVYGLPLVFVHALVIRFLGMNAMDSYAVTGCILLLLAFAGTFLLARKIGAGRITAIFCATIYLSSPFVTFHLSYAALGFAFALFPTYFLIAWKSFETLSNHVTLWRKIASMLLLCCTTTLALFMDGYTFMMFALTAGGLAVYFLLITTKKHQWKNSASIIFTYIFAFGVSYVAYTAYVPQASDYHTMSIDVFRGMGADMYTFLVPAKGFHYLYDLLNLSEPRTASLYYGDGSMFSINFLGIGAFLVAGWGYKVARLPRGFLHTILVIAGIAWFLALGPSFKFRSYRPQHESTTHDYHMPESAARFSLGTAWVYQNVPGIKTMRATYRWGAVVRLVLALLCFVALVELKKRYGILAMLAVATLLCLENAHPPFHFRVANHHYQMFRQLERDVIHPMQKYVVKGEVAYFWPSGNDFMVNYISSKTGLRSYNVAGDKNFAIAYKNWPDVIQKMHNESPVAADTIQAMRDGELDVLIVPFFSLRGNAAHWPPEIEQVQQERERFRQLDLPESFFQTFEERYFALIRQSPTRITARSER